MRIKTLLRALPTLSALMMLAFTGDAKAGVIVTIQQVGPNVVAIGSGTINLSGLSFSFTASNSPAIQPSLDLVSLGPNASSVDLYTGFTPPGSMGAGGGNLASAGSGDSFGIAVNFLAVPHNYVSGGPLSGSATFNNQTFSSLGLTPGTYTFTWGLGATAESEVATDSFIIQVGVPEPGTLSLFALGAAGLLLARRRLSK